ncbi:MAG TPA: PIN domain-containing protein [Anaerolineae bacterium]|jgi:predicted nucleic acid-binding protein|nr:PIN domain-containing protein [Anaerolineae bacterium]
MILFGDSSGWVAAYDERDKYHAAAKQIIYDLSGQKVTFVVTDYVVAESITLMRSRLGHARAVAFGDWLLQSPRVRLIRLDLDLWNEAWRFFKMYDDKDFSFTDCASFVVMRRERLRDAFTFDRHFEQAGFRLWPR